MQRMGCGMAVAEWRENQDARKKRHVECVWSKHAFQQDTNVQRKFVIR